MPANPGGELVRTGLVRAQVGDRVDGLGAPLAVTAGGSGPAGELDGLRGVREGDSRGDGDDLEGANLAAAVAGLDAAVGGLDVAPGQLGELATQPGAGCP
jgi:hypothetical protein